MTDATIPALTLPVGQRLALDILAAVRGNEDQVASVGIASGVDADMM
ncbi:hypothetical protein NRB56_28510 [Nocardia sp. RB56]|uniref:Uncharacterized protein n=1 Tax=Nocardia aurantia TaxID=2585199 RepID=A0A7K0DNT4_9NOCA|nr:hypothetical protein [Nocardia aurantia]